jgi:cytochrome c5
MDFLVLPKNIQIQDNITLYNMKQLVFFGLIFVFTFSCKEKTNQTATPTQTEIEKNLSPEEFIPSDPKLAEKYKRSCFMCHSNSDAGAPIVKATGMWKERIDQRGLEGLLKNTIEGYNAMPAKGQCLDCTDEELAELIKFMADIK